MSIIYANCQREAPFDFSARSTVGTGGFAPLALYPQNEEELLLTLQYPTPYFVVGNMSNLLPPDGEYAKRIICTKRLKQTRRTPNGLYLEAGVTAIELLRVCKRFSLSGAEFLEGIPCTLGGAAFMNAGVRGAHMSDILQSVTVFRDGQRLVLPVTACEYAYKHSVFMENSDTIIGMELVLERASEREIDARILEYRSKRRHLPKGRSMGCVFKNPNGELSAGSLIEGAGLKGLRNGNAFVSSEHANFIINGGGATSAQIKTLINIVKNAVHAQYGISLEEEIRYIT